MKWNQLLGEKNIFSSKLISPEQYVYQEGRSTKTAWLEINSITCSCLDRGKLVGWQLMDTRAVFNLCPSSKVETVGMLQRSLSTDLVVYDRQNQLSQGGRPCLWTTGGQHRSRWRFCPGPNDISGANTGGGCIMALVNAALNTQAPEIEDRWNLPQSSSQMTVQVWYSQTMSIIWRRWWRFPRSSITPTSQLREWSSIWAKRKHI